VARAVAGVVVRAADGATRLVTHLLGAGPAAGRERISEAELRDLVAANTVLDADERRIIDEVLVAGASLVREVMMPRTEVVFLSARLTVAEAAELARTATHTRYPVVDGTHDDVVGFVHLRDLLLRPDPDPAPRATVGQLTREVKRLPGSKRVLAALTEMRRERHHLAVVVDEYGGTAGIVTLEDLIEELIGEIHDEYDTDPDPVQVGLPAVVDGRLNLAHFAERTGVVLPAGPYETVGGYVMAVLGRLPVVGDEAPVTDQPAAGAANRSPANGPAGRPVAEPAPAGWSLRVLALEGRRVARVAVAVARPVELRRATSTTPAQPAAGGGRQPIPAAGQPTAVTVRTPTGTPAAPVAGTTAGPS
jgi:putative hemolysin